MLLSGFVALLLVLTAEAKVGNVTGPLCHPETECLVQHQIFHNAEVDVRYYDATQWAFASDTFYGSTNGLAGSSQLLVEYFNGANENGTVMTWASPTIIQVPFRDFMENTTVMVGFLLTSQYQDTPPKPTNNAVGIFQTAGALVYTRVSSEFTVSGINSTVNALSDYLNANGVPHIQDYFCVAFHSTGVIEVWLTGHAEAVSSSNYLWESHSFESTEN